MWQPANGAAAASLAQERGDASPHRIHAHGDVLLVLTAGEFVGVELDDAVGKNDGSVKGVFGAASVAAA